MILQKFKRGWRVKVADKMPPLLWHFPCGFEAIVEYTHGQKYKSNEFKDYALIVLRDGKPVNFTAWYPESTLTLISDDAESGKRIIENYRYGED